MTQTSEVTIRPAGPDDAEAMTRIAHQAKRHWGYADELIELWRPDLTVTRSFIDSHPVFLAVRGADLLGFYALSNEGDVFELEHMWVDPIHIGRGIGAALFTHAVATVVSFGGSVLEIASDPNAQGFYERMGAVRTGAVPSRPEGRVLPRLSFRIGQPD